MADPGTPNAPQGFRVSCLMLWKQLKPYCTRMIQSLSLRYLGASPQERSDG